MIRIGIKLNLIMDELITLSQAAKILKVHQNTLRNWDRSGVLKAIRIGVKRGLRYQKKDLEKFIKK